MSNSSSSRWMPTAGGVLNIVTGVLGLIGGKACAIICAVLQSNKSNIDIEDPEAFTFMIAILWIACAITFIPSIISIIGGVFAIQRKKWGWALAGSICAILCSTITGVLALIFIVMGKKEFSAQENDI
ncbi:MAG: hypothetical protein FWF98_00930 [Dehalococcoidia bacterium]|nr:hypothetical protein [Dehalococcoidia bacterium]